MKKEKRENTNFRVTMQLREGGGGEEIKNYKKAKEKNGESWMRKIKRRNKGG